MNLKQMKEIKLGLKSNIDVSIYAKTKYTGKQMKRIRMKLEKEK